jgi:hypothetical protein
MYLQLAFFLLIAFPAASTPISPNNVRDISSWKEIPEDVAKNVMNHLNFQDSLSFAQAFTTSDAINPLKSNNLNPLSYCHPRDKKCRLDFILLPKIFKIENIDDRLFYLQKLIDRQCSKRLLLTSAAEHGDVRTIKFLVDNGYELDVFFYKTLVRFGHVSVVNELINKVGERPDYFVRVLNDAVFRNEVHEVRELLAVGFSHVDLVSADLFTKNIQPYKVESDQAKYLEIKKLISDAREQSRTTNRKVQQMSRE